MHWASRSWNLQAFQQGRQCGINGIASHFLREQQSVYRQHRQTVHLRPASGGLPLQSTLPEHTCLLAAFENIVLAFDERKSAAPLHAGRQNDPKNAFVGDWAIQSQPPRGTARTTVSDG